MEDHSHIPGTTPLDDISGLKKTYIRTREQLFEAEFENISNAIFKYLSQKPSKRTAPYNLLWIKNLHKEMFGDVWCWAGEIRKTEKNIGLKMPLHQIEVELQKMLDALFVWKEGGMDIIEQAAMLHHKAVQIHPFENGNGRWARLLANIWLKLHDAPVTLWPVSEMSSGTSFIRDDYLNAIKAADNYDYKLLIELHKSYTKNE